MSWENMSCISVAIQVKWSLVSESAYCKSVYNRISFHVESTNVNLKYEYMKLPIAHVVSIGAGPSNKGKIICCGCLKGMLRNEREEMTGYRRNPHNLHGTPHNTSIELGWSHQEGRLCGRVEEFVHSSDLNPRSDGTTKDIVGHSDVMLKWIL
jgi:hypothetical protein